ncbi:MAG: STAS domain-containing protein [Eubacteriales bacterium]|nr:STAS domain-containing protein [Eubacteriales bacterium]
MQITKSVTEGTLTVRIEGRLDTTTAPMLEGELKRSVTDGTERLIFDFEKVEYMSSAGIRVLMAADRVMSRQGEMKLIHVNEDIMEILDMTGLTDFLTIE